MARKRTNRRGRAGGAKRPSPARRTVARALIGAFAALIVASLCAIGWLVIAYPKKAGPGPGREVTLEIEPGLSAAALAERLAEAGVLEDPELWATYVRLLGADHHLRAGTVLLSDDMSPEDVLRRVAAGFGHATVRVTIPEGFDRFDIAARLARWEVCDADDFLAATADPALLRELQVPARTAEGYLFPDTYRFRQGLAAPDVVRRLVGNFHRRVGPIHREQREALRWLQAELGWSAHEALILASIVEKEAAVPDERPVIARVFINRMRSEEFRPKRMQADPTVSYGCRAQPEAAPSCADFDGRTITRAMLSDRANRYNTYRHEGLPPGPICNPGRASIEAVLTAEPHDYLYFVARGGGRHTFSATLDEHNEAVDRYRRGQ